MKRYTSCLVFAAWLCASAKADDDSGYTPPQPLREAVTARSAATDINDTSLTGTPDPAPTVVPQIDEIAEKPMAPAMVQTKRLFTDPITEMMGGEFNTEDNQRMAESFLSVRPRILHLKANRDF
ncbi:hypothetical protein Emed_005951 [Eimeria media]